MNNKGFMMAEVVVVSSIIMVFLTGLYISYNKLFAMYKERSTYYNVSTLYRLAGIIDNKSSQEEGNVRNSYWVNGTDETGKIEDIGSGIEVYIVKTGELGNFISTGPTINSKFRDYLNFLSSSISSDSSDIIAVMEECDVDNKDKCNYAYLDVFSLGDES